MVWIYPDGVDGSDTVDTLDISRWCGDVSSSVIWEYSPLRVDQQLSDKICVFEHCDIKHCCMVTLNFVTV